MNINFENLKQRNTDAEIRRAASLVRKVREKDGLDFSHHPDSQKCFLWMAQWKLYKESENNYPPPEKCLLLTGQIGTGKTTMVELMSKICNIRCFTMREIDRAYGRNPDNCYEKYEIVFDHSSPVIIDDVGAEAGMRFYGNPPILLDLMTDLYENWKHHGKLVIITTNLKINGKPDDPNTIMAKMGPRIESRFHEMFTKVVFVGSDRRLEEAEW